MAKKKPITPASVSDDYEAELIRRNKLIQKQIDQLYADVINEIAPLASTYNLPSGVFSLEKLPTLNAKIKQLITKLNNNIEILAKSGIMDSWALSNSKNDRIADIRLKGSSIPANKKLIFYDTNLPALKAYTERKVNGLSLSDRIYKQGEVFRAQLEAGIGEGIAVGRSAADMGVSLKQYLKNPDTLFRRIKNAKGVLKLSKNAKAYHPGQGVYRSASKNIKRLTRTENNMAYRNSDMERYKQTPFITGYEVKLSAAHPRFDICDSMKGKYPLGFTFIGWHPQCLCFCVPIMMDEKQFIQYQQLVATGKDTTANINQIAARVTSIPESASQWINDNAERVAGWNKPPLWWQQNKVKPTPIQTKPVEVKTVNKFKEEKSFGLLKKDAQKLIGDRVNSLMNEYPKADLKRVGADVKGRTIGLASASMGSMGFNRVYYNNPTKFADMLKTNISAGHFHKATTPESIIDHEFGHILTVKALDTSVRLTPFASDINRVFAQYKTALNESTKNGIGYLKNPDFVSKYSHTNVKEFVAESFAFARNDPNASKYAKEVLNLINKYFK